MLAAYIVLIIIDLIIVVGVCISLGYAIANLKNMEKNLHE